MSAEGETSTTPQVRTFSFLIEIKSKTDQYIFFPSLVYLRVRDIIIYAFTLGLVYMVTLTLLSEYEAGLFACMEDCTACLCCCFCPCVVNGHNIALVDDRYDALGEHYCQD